MDQLIETFEYVRLHRKNWHGDSNVSVDPLAAFLRKQAFALGLFAGQLAGAADSLGFFPGAFFGRLFVKIPQFHFAKYTFALKFFLKGSESLIDIVVTNKYLHVCFRFCSSSSFDLSKHGLICSYHFNQGLKIRPMWLNLTVFLIFDWHKPSRSR